MFILKQDLYQLDEALLLNISKKEWYVLRKMT